MGNEVGNLLLVIFISLRMDIRAQRLAQQINSNGDIGIVAIKCDNRYGFRFPSNYNE